MLQFFFSVKEIEKDGDGKGGSGDAAVAACTTHGLNRMLCRRWVSSCMYCILDYCLLLCCSLHNWSCSVLSPDPAESSDLPDTQPRRK